jgi:hypothetical protein
MAAKSDSRNTLVKTGLKEGHELIGLAREGYQAKQDTSAPVQPPRVGTTAVIPLANSNGKPVQTTTDKK